MNETFLFTMADQERFARSSGDCNPIHVDPVAARRTQAGQVVVHGVHMVLRCLEALARDGAPLAQARALRVQFSRFMFLDRPLHGRVKSDERQTRCTITGEQGLTLASITVEFGERRAPSRDAPAPAAGVVIERPLAPEIEDIPGLSGVLAPAIGAGALAESFPMLTAALGRRRVIGLALLSTLVGMACPGLHSIFSSIKVDFIDNDDDALSYRVRDFDTRFGLVSMEVHGLGVSGAVEAFRRQPPAQGEPVSDLLGRVGAGEFAHMRALVLGGSRGLGAASAKLIAVGGGAVTITYATGAADARAVRTDINATLGREACAAAPFDLSLPIAAQLEALAGPFTHLLYFATPQIARQKKSVYSPELFREFTHAYVDAFHVACETLLRAGGALTAFYPSSVFVEERPQGMTEYAMAKAAGEQLCRDLARGAPNLKILAPRLPRVLTDQTASVTPTELDAPSAIMAPLLRALG